MRTRALMLVLLVPWSLLRRTPTTKAVKDELDRHQGTWVASTSVYDGQEAPAEIVRSITRIVEKDHVVWKRNGKIIRRDDDRARPLAEPKAIDVIPDGGTDRGERVLGIYKLEDDTPHDLHGRAGPAPAQGVQGREGERLHPPHVHPREDLGEEEVTRRPSPVRSQAEPSR